MTRSEILKIVDANIVIKNCIQYGEEISKGRMTNIFSNKMVTEFSGSDPSKIIRIAVFAHKNQDGLWEGAMAKDEEYVLYGYYEFKTQQIDFIWQRELACRACEGDTYFKSHEDKGIGKVMRLVYTEY